MGKLIGSILLMLGTCVGAAVLALPIVTASEPFYISFLLVSICWFLMSLGAWSLFAVTKGQPLSANLLSLCSATLGKPARILTWLTYLFLLYALICAYLTGSSDIIHSVLSSLHCPRWLATVMAALILSAVVYRGIAWVDWSNRFLMITKLALFLALLTAISFHNMSSDWGSSIVAGQAHCLTLSNIMVIVTSFGFAIIIPSLRGYLSDDRKHLAWALGIGSLLPLFLYLIWIAAVQGAIPWAGVHGLLAMSGASHTATMLMSALYSVTEIAWLKPVSLLFVSLSALTALLSVSVCLVDFLADGVPVLAMPKRRWALLLLTYGPPMLVVLFDPTLFITALSWAGYCCVYILIVLPITMWLASKYR